MICGTLQTLNEEAFEDVLGSDTIQSPTGEGLMLIQQLAPIRESSEYSSPPEDATSLNAVMTLNAQIIPRNYSSHNNIYDCDTVYQVSRSNTPPPPSLTPSSSTIINMAPASEQSSPFIQTIDDTRL